MLISRLVQILTVQLFTSTLHEFLREKVIITRHNETSTAKTRKEYVKENYC